jgi:hypothetical protein
VVSLMLFSIHGAVYAPAKKITVDIAWYYA